MVEELNKKITKYEEINKLFVSLEKIRQTGKELEARQAESKERRQQIENARKADKVLVAEQQNLRQQQEVEQSAQAIAKMTETLANDQEMFESLKTQLAGGRGNKEKRSGDLQKKSLQLEQSFRLRGTAECEVRGAAGQKGVGRPRENIRGVIS